MSVRAIFQRETTKIQEYIRKMAPTDGMLNEYRRQEEKEMQETLWKDRCMVKGDDKVADIEKFYHWLDKAGLKRLIKMVKMGSTFKDGLQ